MNGQTITTPGFKADRERDHIRVDGKLLHGAERLRYFLLNKPRGYVTTVSDPEGRPTVMQFFSRLSERLYPVGRLDFQSEGLLLVTNDGPLANQLTRAASSVEKTYLVKVSGQPSEEAIERLQSGVAIPKSRPGEGKVRTAPARIRLARAGENPWYEIVLIEGRNRELRKMFAGEGHNVEKIRRVGYGPLWLDVPAGEMRELTTAEVDLLRLAAAGKYRSRKIDFSVLLPKEAGRTVDHEAAKEFKGKRPPSKNFRFQDRNQRREQGPATREGGRSRSFGDKPSGKPFRQPQTGSRPEFRAEPRREFGAQSREERPFQRGPRPAPRPGGKPAFGRQQTGGMPAFRAEPRRESGAQSREERPVQRGPRPGPRPGGKPAFGSQQTGGKRFDRRPPPRSFEIRDEEGRTEVGGESRPKSNFDRNTSDRTNLDRTGRVSPRPRREEGEAPRGRFGRGNERSQGRYQGQRPDRAQDRYQDRGGERGSRGSGSEERSGRERDSAQRGSAPRVDQRGGQSFRPSGERSSAGNRTANERGGFGKGRETGGAKKFGSKPAGKSGAAGGSRSEGGSRSGGKPAFKPGFKAGFKSGPKSGPKSGFGGKSGGGKRGGPPRGKGR